MILISSPLRRSIQPICAFCEWYWCTDLSSTIRNNLNFPHCKLDSNAICRLETVMYFAFNIFLQSTHIATYCFNR